MDYNVLGPANVASRPNASPLLSISENNGTRTDSFVFQWGGTSWLPLGGAIDPNTGVILQNGPPIAVSTTGRPFVFLYESASLLGAASGRVREWSGTSWDVVGAAINPVTGQGLADGALGLDSADRPIVVLREPSGASARTNAYAVRWTGAAWTNMGGALNPVPAQDVTNASMAMDSKGRPAVVLTVSDGSVTNAYVYRSNN
jgi:hypothetical protein